MGELRRREVDVPAQRPRFDLFPRIAEEAGERLVGAGDAAVLIVEADPDEWRLDHAPEPRLAGAEAGDVGLGDADPPYLAGGIPDREAADQQLKLAAAGCGNGDLAVEDGLAGLEDPSVEGLDLAIPGREHIADG